MEMAALSRISLEAFILCVLIDSRHSQGRIDGERRLATEQSCDLRGSAKSSQVPVENMVSGHNSRKIVDVATWVL
jgi:hypothetical protein